ncbi:MAG: glycosyltransferase [Alphaproteobacteria bacterium]|nr:glycosyltransferase [Alphaproteobacteria bacterium]
MKKYITIFISTLLIICFIAYKLFFSNPLVSIILITYNRADLIENAINSILAQTYKNWELIIVNDGSGDNTSKIIKEYAAKDKRIKIFENDKNKKIVYSRNRGLSNAKGKYIAWIDDDDKAYANKIKQQVKYMEKHKDITILGTDISLINGDRKVYLGSVEYTPEESEIAFLIGRLPVILETTMWRHEFIKKHNIQFNANVPLSEDLVIYDDVLKNNGKIMTLPETLYKYRVHRTNPKETYSKIGRLQKKFYNERWSKFYPDTQYPKSQCERLKFIQENNKYFNQNVLDSMVNEHCQTQVFIPSSYAWFIPFEDEEEPVVVSADDKKFYSYKMGKSGKIVKIRAAYIDIIWEGETEPKRYFKKIK